MSGSAQGTPLFVLTATGGICRKAEGEAGSVRKCARAQRTRGARPRVPPSQPGRPHPPPPSRGPPACVCLTSPGRRLWGALGSPGPGPYSSPRPKHTHVSEPLATRDQGPTSEPRPGRSGPDGGVRETHPHSKPSAGCVPRLSESSSKVKVDRNF